MKIFAETNRSILREILPTDVDGLFELDSDSEVHRYLGNQPVQNKDEIVEVIKFIRKQYVENGIGRWAIVEKETNNFIGWTGLKLVKEETNGHINFYDIGYRLIKKYWGNGFATESAIASLDYGFKTMNLKEIFATADIENSASNKVLTKVGLKLIEQFKRDGIVQNWYKITRDEWSNREMKIYD